MPYKDPQKQRLCKQRYTDRNKAKIQAWHTVHSQHPIVRMGQLVAGARHRAKLGGFEFDERLQANLQLDPPTHCACCGVKFDFVRRGTRRQEKACSPSLDRRDNSQGYTLENTAVICVRCNSLKSDASASELAALAAYAASGGRDAQSA
jgi:hypothetical protein